MAKSLLVLSLTVAIAAACGREPRSPHPEHASATSLLEDLTDPVPDVRRRAAEDLGRSVSPCRAVIYALLEAQHDDDEAVAAAALAALDHIQPRPEVAERIQAHGSYQTIGRVMIAPAHVRWTKVECEGVVLAGGETLDGCWRFEEVPAAYESCIKHFDPPPGQPKPDAKHPGPHVWRRAVGVNEEAGTHSVPPPAVVPDEVSDRAQPGEVWCRVATGAGPAWRRAPACGGATPRK